MMGLSMVLKRSVTVPSRSFRQSIRLPQRSLNPWVRLHLLLSVVLLDSHFDVMMITFKLWGILGGMEKT